MHKRGYTQNMKGVGGTSAGAIVALAVGLGWRDTELEDRLLRQDYADFLKIDRKELRSIFRNVRGRSGVLSGKELRRWCQEMLAERLGDPLLNFHGWQAYQKAAAEGDIDFFKAKFHRARGFEPEIAALVERAEPLYSQDGTLLRKAFAFDFNSPEELMANAASMLELRVMGAKSVHETRNGKRYRTGQIEKKIFSAEATPTLHIATAVKSSASYPFVFRQTNIDGELHTDAGVVAHVPFDLYETEARQGKVLAFDTIRNIEAGVPIENKPLAPHWQRLKKVVMGDTTVHEAAQRFLGWLFTKKRIEEAYAMLDATEEKIRNDPQLSQHIIPLDRGNVGTTDFLDVGPDENRWLMDSGGHTVEKKIDDYEQHLERQTQRDKEAALHHKQTPPPHQQPLRIIRATPSSHHPRIHHHPPRNDTWPSR